MAKELMDKAGKERFNKEKPNNEKLSAEKLQKEKPNRSNKPPKKNQAVKPVAKGGNQGLKPNPKKGIIKKTVHKKDNRANCLGEKKPLPLTLSLDQEVLRNQILALLAEEDYRALKGEELAKALKLDAKTQTALWPLLKELENRYEVVKNKKYKYVLPAQIGILEGVLLAHDRGFGFVRTKEPNLPDIHISKRDIGNALHKDVVLVRVAGDYKRNLGESDYRPEGKILKVLKEANRQVIGSLESLGKNWLVYPDEKRLTMSISIVDAPDQEVHLGDKVVVEIVHFGNKNRPAIGKVIRVLGSPTAVGVDMLSVIWQHNLADEFSAPVLEAAAKVAVPFTAGDLAARKDCREQTVIAIDGIDTKDRDDAIGCEMLANGNFSLSVHIADVTHYVRAGSILDQEAFERGTSVYLPDRVMPMLPPVLSNGICSLDEGQDRLALSCTMEITPQGNIKNQQIYPSVIRVDKCLDYDTVNRILMEASAADSKANKPWLPLLESTAKLQRILEQKRVKRGSINFDFPETKVVMDPETGRVLDVKKRSSGLAEKLIEEAMIVTNEVVATSFYHRQIPFIYRVHKGPSEEKTTLLNQAVGPLGLGFTVGEGGVKPKDIQKLLTAVADKPYGKYIQTLALRSMSHAVYSAEPIGHFGLASPYYSHFTSPIRRYSDLAIHRVIKAWGLENPNGDEKEKLQQQMELAAKQSSEQEKAAEDAEREAVDIKCCQFMAGQIGNRYSGSISGVIAHGIFVELESTIEGRVGIDDLPKDQYSYNPATMTIEGKKYNWRLGDPVSIVVSRVDIQAKQIDFVLAEN